MQIRKRIILVMFSFLALFTVLAAAIGYHQIIKGPELAKQAVAMRSKQVELKEFPRGEILDRNLIPLTGNQSSDAVYYLFTQETAQPQNMQKAAAALASAIGNVSSRQVMEKLEAGKESGAPFVRIALDLSAEQIARINLSGTTGIVVAPISKRYSNEGFCAHILGYISTKGDYKGQAGLEKIYDDILRKNSFERQLVTVLDARGMAIQGLMFKIRQEQASEQGTVVLTIDRRIQKIVEDYVNPVMAKGAVVILDIKTREILAMVSRPAFNQYQIEKVLQTGENSPLINRALNSYHPGSLFKILVAAAALAEEKITLEEKFLCSGKIDINEEVSISCWKEAGHGSITFAEAFANSCNPAFIETGLKLGKDNLLKYAAQFKVTDNTIIGYPNYQRDSFININPGQAAVGNASLGQQGIMLTPLQIASLIATIAGDGWYKSPLLVKYTVNREGKRQNYTSGDAVKVLETEAAQSVQKLMEDCVAKGTGKSAALKEVMAAGKTATSQTGIIENDNEVLNAWFGGYLPAEQPRWAIVVLVEEGESGAAEAAPIFKAIAQKLLPLYTSSNPE